MVLVLNVLPDGLGNILKFMIGCRSLLSMSVVAPVNRVDDERVLHKLSYTRVTNSWLRSLRQSYKGVLPLCEKYCCLYVKNIIAQGLSVLRILSKQPPIEVMMQEHVNAMTRPSITVYFPTVLS